MWTLVPIAVVANRKDAFKDKQHKHMKENRTADCTDRVVTNKTRKRPFGPLRMEYHILRSCLHKAIYQYYPLIYRNI